MLSPLGQRWVALKPLMVPALLAVLVILAIEAAIAWAYHPNFWQKTTWLMHDPYRGELFDRNQLYIRLSHLEDSDPDIISVGDSSGFFSLQSTIVNRHTRGLKYLNLNTGANQAFIGYQGIAEYMLRRSSKIKYVVLYIYPQLLPQAKVIEDADLGPITYDSFASIKAVATPPSTFLSPYAKRLLFEKHRFHWGDPLSNHVPGLQLASTVDDALGWLPEFDQRFDRIDGRAPFHSDARAGWFDRLGFGDPSELYVNLDGFERMVRRYGARLVVAFAPVAQRVILPGDLNIVTADRALARFQQTHPEVKFLFPLLTRWSIEKFGMYNHVAREYTHLSSRRLGEALGRLVETPDSIPPYQPNTDPRDPYDTVTVTPRGAADPRLIEPALAFYLYTSTLDPKYRALLSDRVQGLLRDEPAFTAATADAERRLASLARRDIKIGFDLSRMHATPVEVAGLPHCGTGSNGGAPQWVQLDGTMVFTYDSPAAIARAPVAWPRASRILVPTVVKDGVARFDGYCPEPSLQ